MQAATDLELAAAAVSGDRVARDRLLARHRSRIIRMCAGLCGTSTDLDDVLQETYIALLRALPTFRGESSFSTWAYTVARTHRSRALRAASRERTRVQRLHHLVVVSAPPPRCLEDSVAGSELSGRVHDALSQLAPLDRAVLSLRDLEGCSAIETASSLGLTVSAVKTRLHRARRQLRALLTPVLDGSELRTDAA